MNGIMVYAKYEFSKLCYEYSKFYEEKKLSYRTQCPSTNHKLYNTISRVDQ